MRQQGPCVENVLDQAGFTEEEKLLGGKAPPPPPKLMGFENFGGTAVFSILLFNTHWY